jgi:hypothetical protein
MARFQKAQKQSPGSSFIEDNLTMLAMAGIAGAFVLYTQRKKKASGASINGAPAIGFDASDSFPSVVGHVHPPALTAPGVIGCDCGTEF